VPGKAPPYNTPVVLTTATLAVAGLHIPPGVALLNVLVAPGHTVAVPTIGAGTGFTLIVAVFMQPVSMV
jgi:hypothetical protein